MTTRDIEEVFLVPDEEKDNFDEAFEELKGEQTEHLKDALNYLHAHD